MFLQILVVLGTTNYAELCCQWWPGNVWGDAVPHPANQGGWTAGLGLCGCGLLVLDQACVEVKNVAHLGLTQQEALDAPSDWLVAYVLLDGKAVLGGNHALVEAELLVGAVVL